MCNAMQCNAMQRTIERLGCLHKRQRNKDSEVLQGALHVRTFACVAICGSPIMESKDSEPNSTPYTAPVEYVSMAQNDVGVAGDVEKG